MDRTLLPQSIHDAILQRAGIPADAKAIAEAMVAICRVLSAQLAPVIGRHGLDVLFRRALHQASTVIPAIAQTEESRRSLVSLQLLQAFLAGQSTSVAIETSTAVLVSFTELLATFIGDSLTERLLAPVWGVSPPSQDQKAVP